MMGVCFKLFGQSIEDEKITKSTGSAFYVAEHYLLTCNHLVNALKPGDQLNFCYGSSYYSAVLLEIAEGWDLALLYTGTPAQEEWIFSLDRVALAGRKAVAYGYPHGLGFDEQSDLKIGSELDAGVPLTNANGVTIGFSGGPVCPASDLSTAIGVISTITGTDEFGRRSEGASFVPVRVALELWGDRYGLLEKRYTDVPDAFGINDFVYSAEKTIFQDPYDYLVKLRTFLEEKRPVLWWAVVAPGGSGKSRLCYELAASLNSNWRCKLVQVGELEKKNLQALYEEAGRSFLLIADYAYSDTNELGAWLEECARTQNGPHIRVLLLQREAGNNNVGWQESLLRCRRNLINLRYKEDLQLEPMEPEYIISIMRSYAVNMGGGKIDAPALYTVLENVDPGLTRPLFAMFIADAALKGDGPLEWDRENALKYFIRRVRNDVERALGEKDAKAVMLLLIIATIANGFTFDMDLLDSEPLCGLEDLIGLSEKAFFGERLYNARLADRDHGRYTIKPMKPDLLGEFYVLDSFREMMGDQQQEESVSALLEVAKKADQDSTSDFLTRLFTDYETDEKFAQVCCREDDVFHSSVSNGLIMRPDIVLLQKLYKAYGTELWMGGYSLGLLNAISKQNKAEKAGELLEKLRKLQKEHSKNIQVTYIFILSLLDVLSKQSDPRKVDVLLDEFREIHWGYPGNAEIAEILILSLLRVYNKLSGQDKADALLLKACKLYREHPGNSKVEITLISSLLSAYCEESDQKKAEVLLYESCKLYKKCTRKDEIAPLFSASLAKAINDEKDSKKREALLDEARKSYRDVPGNADVKKLLIMDLLTVFLNQGDQEKKEALLYEACKLYGELPGNVETAEILAFSLQKAIIIETESVKIDALLEELRLLSARHPGNSEVEKMHIVSLLKAYYERSDQENAEALLYEACKLCRENSEYSEVAGELAEGLLIAYCHQTDSKKAGALLDELRELHNMHPGNAVVTMRFVQGLGNAVSRIEAWMDVEGQFEEFPESSMVQPGNVKDRIQHAKDMVQAYQTKLEEVTALLKELNECLKRYNSPLGND